MADDFGKVVDALHNKNKLSALRTYQGDMAEFIKEKNVSVISAAVKEQERKQEREKKEAPKVEAKTTKPKDNKLKSNAILVLISLLLVAGGVVGFMLVARVLNTGPVPEVSLEKAMIPYNDFATLAVSTSENFREGLSKVTPGSGITLVKVSGLDGQTIQKAKDFFDFLEISLPSTLSRNLRSDWVLGVVSRDGKTSSFLVFTVSDFGGAFAGMLDWEGKMENDLSFLSADPMMDMTSLLSTTTTALKQESFEWKDMIVKNKDTRGLVDERDRSKIAYTFLDKNTVLVVGDILIIGDLSSAYASRAVAR